MVRMSMHFFRVVLLALLCAAPAITLASPGTDAYHAGDFRRAFTLFDPQAKRGFAEAQYFLGRMYENGEGIDTNRDRALYWYSRAAAQGHIEARAAVESLGGAPLATGPKPLAGAAPGPMATSSAGPPTGKSAAHPPANPSANPAGNAAGKPSAGKPFAPQSDDERLMAMLDARLPYDRTRAPQLAEALKRRAETGHAGSAAALGLYFESPLPAPSHPDFISAARWYARAAELGHPLAANNLGALYFEGRGVQRDFEQAARLYRVSAEGGYAIGQYNLALMLGQGRGTAPDVPQMLGWLNKSAAQQYPRAQAQLARLYREGIAVEKNAVEAGRLFLAAAQAGNTNAQYWYGQMITAGNGVSRDLSIGADWIIKAADAGMPLAQQEAAAIFELGLGRAADDARAASYYRKAGEAGVKEAAARLANAYANGELGLPQNTGEAALWAARAK